MKQIFLFALILLGASLISMASAEGIIDYAEEITEQSCDAMNACLDELECFSFPGIGLRCAQPDPCSYFNCPEGTECVVAESYPGQVKCSCFGPECPVAGDSQDAAVYDVSTGTVIHIVKPDDSISHHNISLHKSTDENTGGILSGQGILKTDTAQAEYSNELVVENSILFMETSAGKKQINVLPEDAIGLSEISSRETVKRMELKEEAQRPVYSVRSERRSRLFFIIPVSMRIETIIDAETSEVVSVNKPWWSFLSR